MNRQLVPASELAFALLERRETADVGLYYLFQNGGDKATLDRLANTPVPSGLETRKADALQAIERKIASPLR